MKSVTVTFRITKDKTILSTSSQEGLTIDVLEMDITGGSIEQDFIKLLKKIQESREVERHTTDFNDWEMCRPQSEMPPDRYHR